MNANPRAIRQSVRSERPGHAEAPAGLPHFGLKGLNILRAMRIHAECMRKPIVA